MTNSQPSSTTSTTLVDCSTNTNTDISLSMSKIINFVVVAAVSVTMFSGDLLFRNVEAFQQQQQRQWMPTRTTATTATQLQLQRHHGVIQSGTEASTSHNRRFRRHRAISVPFNAATNPTPPQSPFSSSSNEGPNESTSSSSWDEIFATTAVSTNNHNGMVGNQQQLPKHDELTVVDKSIIVGCATFVVVAFTTILRVSEPGSWRYFLAGGMCAMVSHAIPTPIDVIKTRKQVDPRLADKGFLAAGRIIVQEEGVSALCAGLGPTAWGYLFEGAVKFGVYEVSKPVMRSFLSRLASTTSIAVFRSQLLSFALCGAVAGFAASFMLCPMEALRIRLVAEPSFAPKGWIQGGTKILKNEGVQGLTKGMTPMVLKQVPYTVTKNVSFDIITRFLYSTIKATGASISTTASVAIPLFAAASASVLSTISSQPGDMVLSLVNAHKGNQTVRDFVNGILRSERGVRGFFVGFKTRLLLSGVTVTIQLLVYDMVKRLCGIAATGSM
mmetsp:Transcript_10709/g.25536  ORF Transcript_10709/g.25536 Transcript_10709/m.25536 type:complete len:499 (-) Transcript_10709:48-1544(-)